MENQFSTNHLLDTLGDVKIKDLLNDPNTEIIKKGNKLYARYRSECGIASLELSAYATDRSELRSTSVPDKSSKRDYTNDILEMKKRGMLQKDIAFTLDISPSYVSCILKSHRGR